MTEGKRLESWKEIAAYLQRDVTTVMRWEKFEGLPARRHQHMARSSVYAYPAELDAWRQARQPAAERLLPPQPVWRRLWPSLAFSLVMLLALLSAGDVAPYAIKARAQSPGPGLTTRLLWAEKDVDLSGAPTPDGRSLVYVHWETGDLALHDFASGQMRKLTTDGTWEQDPNRWAYWSVVSQDGKQVAYNWNTDGSAQELRVAGIEDPKPRVLYSNREVNQIQPMDWSSDGKHVVALLRKGVDKTFQIALISTADGAARVLKSLEWRWPQGARLSPDGRYLAYDVPAREDSPERDIFLLATDGGNEVPLVKHPAVDWGPMWAPDGRNVVFVSNRSGSSGLWAIAVAGGKPQGDAELLKADVGFIKPLGFAGKGSFYYGVRRGTRDIYAADLDPATGLISGQPKRFIETFVGQNHSPAFSPDGKQLAYFSGRDPAAMEGYRLVIRSLETGEERLLPFRREQVPAPRWVGRRWSPDGRFLFGAGVDAKGRRGIYRIDVGTGEAAAITLGAAGGGVLRRSAFSPDGKVLFYAHPSSIMRREIQTGEERELLRRPWSFNSLATSPDGRQLAIATSRGISLMPSAGGELRSLVMFSSPEHIDTWAGFAWTPDGRYLLFGKKNAGTSAEPVELYRISAQGGEPQKLGAAMPTLQNLSIHPDGRRIAFSAARSPLEGQMEVWVLDNLLPERRGRR